MAQPRVHEFAKEVGVPSKEVIAKLKDMGEFVKSSSSTLNPMVLKKLRAEFPAAAAKPAAKAAPAESAAKPAAKPAPKPAAAKPAAKPAAAPKPAAAKPAAKPAPKPAAESAAPKPAAAKPAAKPAAAPKPGGPRPGNNPFASQQGMARPEAAPKPAAPKPAAPKPGPKPGPRPGNNPFASQQGMKRGGGDSQRSGGPRPARNGRPGGNGGARPGGNGGPRPAGGARPGGNGGPRPAGGARPGAPRPAGGGGARPNPSMMPKVSNVGGGASGSNNGGGNGGGGARRGGGSGGFNRGPGRPGPGGRGNAQGAFGRGGSKRKGRKSKAARRHEQEQLNAPAPGGVVVPRGDGSTEIRLRRGASIMDFAEKIGANPASLITVLFHLGEMATQTQSLDEETFELLGAELGYVIKIVSPEDEERELLESFDINLEAEAEAEGEDVLEVRPPVVTVMGHVDHGKTRLLDAIRNTNVIEGEAGGITQHIGAYQVHTTVEGEDRAITFIDTPGHETFTAMRARGAKVTDIVILIVAADDGVMPQTIESINHAKAAGVPIVVAVNKIDKPGADPTRVRQELTEYGVIPEEWGGQNMFVDISAKQNLGIDDLLETILLQADVLELKANPDTFASGNVLEAKLDRGRGSVATVLVTRGTLHIGDALVAGMAFGRVRAMLDPKGNAVTTAGPSDAVEILGLQTVPGAGDEFRVFQEERDARELADQRALKARIEEQNRVKHVTLENLFDTMADRDVKELNLIIKADVQGSIEALQDSLDKMDQSEVRISTIHSAVGGITETDVVLADASNAIIIGFGVRPDAKAKLAAERVGVEIRTYSVIYKAIEEIDAARIGMLKPTEQEVQTGVAEVRDTFKVPKVGIAAGCMISEGEISRDDNIRLIRDGFVVYDGKIASLRRFKDDVKSVKSGYECGIGLENFQDIKPGDQLEGYRIEQVARTE